MRKCEAWTIAYRTRHEEQTLLDNKEDIFYVIKNNWRYWCADPFLFEWEGQTYLFAELYDRIQSKGVIGYCILSEEGPSEWYIVLDMPFHLSYPFVFSSKEKIYMMPESFRANEIALYEAVDFPNKWKKVKVLSNICAVDSTFGKINEKNYLFTIAIQNGKGLLASFKADEEYTLSDFRFLTEKEDPNTRPGGKMFLWKGKMIRPAQDCEESYGQALNFFELKDFAEDTFREELLQKVYPKDVHTNFEKKAEGIHTYNASFRYEVIDLKEYRFGLLDKLVHLYHIITKK